MNPASHILQRRAFPGPASRAREIGEHFRSLYGESCRLYRAPGRVNLIGEHTDYNAGFVMPVAIDLDCWVAISPGKDRKLTIHSANLDETRERQLDEQQPLGHWSDYVLGVAVMLERSGYLQRGAKILIESNLPLGAGLSSSAALEVATGFALLDTQESSWDRLQLALVCWRAENEFVGARCGIMDQFVACNGKAAHALMIDCRSLTSHFLPIPTDVRIVICNTMVKHAIVAGEYNARRSQCEEGVRLLAKALPGISALRDVTLRDLEQHQELLSSLLLKRCRHVISENERVLAASSALGLGDLKRFGQLMLESHRSLRDDYEVSSRELDFMVETARGIEGVHGVRMTGGGFGGCTVNLVAADAVPDFQQRIVSAYQSWTGAIPEIYVATASESVGRIEMDKSEITINP